MFRNDRTWTWSPCREYESPVTTEAKAEDGLRMGSQGRTSRGREGYLQPMIHQSFLELPRKAHSKVQGPTQTKPQPPAAPLGSAKPRSSALGA